jgi:putative transposase
MQPISYARHQFPSGFVRHPIWLYLRFTLSYCDVEELLAERGLEIPYETVRRWVLKFGSAVAVTCAVCGLDPKTPGTWMRW